MGRHKAIDYFYLYQTYTRIIKHLIRDNVNLFVLFREDDINFKLVYTYHVREDMSYDQFKTICSIWWCNKYGYFVIKKENNLNNGQYHKEFDH